MVTVEQEDRLKVQKQWGDQMVQLQAEQEELVMGNYVSTTHCELI